jgi:hypothetical protein
MKTCFVIAPIGAPNSAERVRSDQLLKHVISPATESCGYRAVRADQLPQPGVITSQVITHLINDDLVIADLTGPNANVFYELAIRHVARKAVIQIIDDVEKIPFDLAATRIIPINTRDLDSVASGRDEIVRQIRASEDVSATFENPVSIAIDINALTVSGNPVASVSAEVVSLLTEVRALLTREAIPAVPTGQSLRMMGSDLVGIASLLTGIEPAEDRSSVTTDQIWYALAQAEARLLEMSRTVGVQLVAGVANANAERLRRNRRR